MEIMYTVIQENKIPPKKLPGCKDRNAEDSLENTFSCVPKVQGIRPRIDLPNLSGKWTETQDADELRRAVLLRAALFVLEEKERGNCICSVNLWTLSDM